MTKLYYLNIRVLSKSVILERHKMAYRNSWTLDARVERWTLDTGLWILDAELWMLDSGRWTLDAGRWTLDSGRWTVDAGS